MSAIVGERRFGVKRHGLFHQASAQRQSAYPHCGMHGNARRFSGRAVGCGSPTIATRPGATALWWAPGRCCATRCPRRGSRRAERARPPGARTRGPSAVALRREAAPRDDGGPGPQRWALGAGAPTADPTVTRSRPTLAPTSSSTTHRAEGHHPLRREDRRSMQRRWPGLAVDRERALAGECQPLTEKLEFGLTSRRRE